MYRYYSRLRPVSIGTCPDGFVNFGNYSERHFDSRANCEVWGYVDYEMPLTQEEVRQYDLKQEVNSVWLEEHYGNQVPIAVCHGAEDVTFWLPNGEDRFDFDLVSAVKDESGEYSLFKGHKYQLNKDYEPYINRYGNVYYVRDFTLM